MYLFFGFISDDTHANFDLSLSLIVLNVHFIVTKGPERITWHRVGPREPPRIDP